MSDLFGFTVPTINISGYLSNTWFYVLIIAVMGFLLIAAVAIVLFFVTYRRKIEFYDDVTGRGSYQKVATRRARVIKLNQLGDEVLKPIGIEYLTAYGKKVGKNTYMFVKGSDGYWRNAIHGELDTKKGILDIVVVDPEIRMTKVALDRLSKQMYEQKKIGQYLIQYGLPIAMIVIFLIGMWILIGKFEDVAVQFSSAAQTIADAVKSSPPPTSNSGIVPVS